MGFGDAVGLVGEASDTAGVAVLAIGAVSILLGLELLVAADIIRTVAVTPSLWSVLVLALIVVIRTFLSFSLDLEITGRWPWQKGAGAPPPEEAPSS